MKTHPTYPARSPYSVKAWHEKDDEYNPIEWLDPIVSANVGVWADDNEVYKWTDFDDRITWYQGKEYRLTDLCFFDDAGRALNPTGRTGIINRGLLGKYGANFCADPIVRRPHPWWWHPFYTFKSQIALVQRVDNGMLAIPGGVCDQRSDGSYEAVSITCKREFTEEAIGDESLYDIDTLFSDGQLIYFGQVEDERNTDHAWMVTQAMLFENNEITQKLKLFVGDPSEVLKAKWVTFPSNIDTFPMHANHNEFIRIAYEKYPFNSKKVMKAMTIVYILILSFVIVFDIYQYNTDMGDLLDMVCYPNNTDSMCVDFGGDKYF
tara:strand:+ start:3043 stop:4005 length:963 start_codon:yes stop_codon:yes gene_type:complete